VDPPADDPERGLGPDRWRRRTLPLLARPELGLTEGVQRRILAHKSPNVPAEDLLKERRRLVRDAFDAAAVQRGSRAPRADDEEAAVDRVVKAIRDLYPQSPWESEFSQAELTNGS